MTDIYAHLAAAAVTDVGRKRKNNEDAFGVHPEAGVFCVADGMGGAEDGEVASRAAVDAIHAMLDRYSKSDRPLSLRAMRAEIDGAIDRASAWIFRRSKRRGNSGTGSTFVCVCFDPENPGLALALHAGDSRLYRIRGDEIVQITRDHSAATLAGVKDERELNPMFRGVVMRAVGVNESVELERTPFEVAADDTVLLCSDGLTRMVPDSEIQAIVAEGRDVQATAQALVDRANAHGGVDNVTAVLIRMGELPSPVAACTPDEVSASKAANVTAPPPDQAKKDAADSGPSGSTQDRSSGPLTPVSLERTTNRGGGSLFSSDTGELVGGTPKAAPESKASEERPAGSAVGCAAAEHERGRPRIRLAVIGGTVAVCVTAGAVFWAVRHERALPGAEVLSAQRVPEQREAAPAPDRTQAASQVSAEQASSEKEAEARQHAEQERQKELQRIAERLKAEEVAKQKAEEAARQAAEEKRKAELREEAARQAEAARLEAQRRADEQRLEKERLAKQQAEREEARRVAEQTAAAEKQRRLAEQKAAEEAQRSLAEQKVRDEQRRETENAEKAKRKAVEEKLFALATDRDTLYNYGLSITVIDDTRKNAMALMEAAKAFVDARKNGEPEAAVAGRQDAFVAALSVTLSSFRRDAVPEWHRTVDTFGYKTTTPATELAHAQHILTQWDKIVEASAALGNLSDAETRLKLVELVCWINAGMKDLQSIPGLSIKK